ncbi:MAG: flagellar hook-length control protein FliK, partial [Acidobacteriota bacterium]|nr:flagellar hook-length control protein FliK [Acidobacteriota bacterium]
PKATAADKANPAPSAGASATGIAPARNASHNEKNSAGGKQHSDTSDSEDAGPSAKAAALASAPKEQAFSPIVNAVNAPVDVVAGMQQSQPAPYSNARTQPPSATEVARTADLPPTPVSRPPQSIDLKIAGADNSQVDVRVSQRAGDVQVTVRTPDNDLAQSLRQHLPELSDRLAQSGVSGEIWRPTAAQAPADTANNQESWNSESQAQQQHQQRNPNGRQNQAQEENGGSSTWQNEFNNTEKEER